MTRFESNKIKRKLINSRKVNNACAKFARSDYNTQTKFYVTVKKKI